MNINSLLYLLFDLPTIKHIEFTRQYDEYTIEPMPVTTDHFFFNLFVLLLGVVLQGASVHRLCSFHVPRFSLFAESAYNYAGDYSNDDVPTTGVPFLPLENNVFLASRDATA